MTIHFNIKEMFQKIRFLLLEHQEPKEIAFGVAVGVFIGCSPFYGFHTLLAILVAFVMRKPNRLAILAGTQISLPFIAPLIYWVEYKIGKALLNSDRLMPEIWQDKLSEVNNLELGLLSVLVGSIFFGIVCAIASYYITVYAAKRFKEKRRRIV